jgi:hypothetical protein
VLKLISSKYLSKETANGTALLKDLLLLIMGSSTADTDWQHLCVQIKIEKNKKFLEELICVLSLYKSFI